MPFKTSFFNPALFKKNLSRSWPLWGGVTAVGALFPLYLILAVMSGQEIFMKRTEFVDFLYNAAAYFLPFFTFCYAALVAMFVWSYLHNSRSVGMLHALPVSRTALFVTNALSGLAMLLIPYVLVGAFLCIFALCCGAMDVGAVALTILAVLLENLLFFGIATFCAMITGNIFAVAGYYLVLNFLAPALDLLVNSLAQEFVFGLSGASGSASMYFAPLMGLYEFVDVVNVTRWREYESIATEPVLEGFWLIGVYGFVGALLLLGAWRIYRARRSECAGDIVAFRGLRPVFRFAVSVLSALTLGRVAYEIFWNALFAQGYYADIVPMLVCMAISAVVGYYTASMLLDKTLRVFKGSLKGVAVVCAATVVIGAAVSVDLFGVENKVPKAEDVLTVDVWGGMEINYRNELHNIALCERAIELHEAILADKEYIKAYENGFEWSESERVAYTSILFEYVLKDGTRLERKYRIPVSQTRMAESGTYDAMLKNFAQDPELLVALVTVPERAQFSGMELSGYFPGSDEWNYTNVEPIDFAAVYAAVLRDAEEGNFCLNSNFYYMWDKELLEMTDWERFEKEPHFSLDYWYYEDGVRRTGNFYLTLQPGMIHTLQALLDCGVVTEEVIAGWNN